MNKYILQYGNLAGWPFQLACALRAAKYHSLNVIQETSDVSDLNRKLPHDKYLCNTTDSRIKKILYRLFFLIKNLRQISLVHYHGGVILSSYWHHFFEGPLFKLMNIPMLMSFGGGDARLTVEARIKNQYSHREPDAVLDKKIRRYLKSISKYIKYVATDPEMITYVKPYFERCFVFFQPVDLDVIKFRQPNIIRPPILLHVPTYPEAKGTVYIEEAVQRLLNEGYLFEFKMMRKLTQVQMFNELSECDVYVDELRSGGYGMTAVEAMSAGKPTLTSIRPDLIKEYPNDLPIVVVNPETIYDQLKKIISSPDLRLDLSFRSRNYVEKYHDMNIVAIEMIKIYKNIGIKL